MPRRGYSVDRLARRFVPRSPYDQEVTTGTARTPTLQRFVPLGLFIGVMWMVEIADQVAFDDGLDRHGILPRSLDGLDGVLWAPFLHGGLGHLVSNTLPVLVLGALVALHGVRRWLVVTLFITLVGGGLTWLFARTAIHIGASLLVFGYITYLVVIGLRERSASGIAIGLLVLLLYGGTLLAGVLPVSSAVSWEGHFFGAIAGGLAAIAATARPEPTYSS